jgi:hypothetical protein
MRATGTLVLLISIPLLTSCSSNSNELKYDEVDLIEYQSCLDRFTGTNKYFSNPIQDVETAKVFCAPLLPKKK